MFSNNDWLFRKEFIEENDQTKGKLYRSKSIWFLEDLGAAAKLDRRVISTASVYFHRFFLFHSFTKHDRFNVAVSCIFLAAKVEESAIRLKDIVNKYYEVRHHGIFPKEDEIKELQKKIILMERLVLNTLNFDLYVIHPNLAGKWKELKNYVPEESKHPVLQTAINFVNDSYRSTLCLQYSSNQIAIGMIYLSFIVLSVKPYARSSSMEITWIGLLEKEIDHISLRNICFEVLDMYELITDKALKIKDKEWAKEQIKKELGGEFYEYHTTEISQADSASLSPSGTDHEPSDEYKYEEDNDEFHIKRQPKITVTHVKPANSLSLSSSTPVPPPPSDTPTGSESVESTISHYDQGNQYIYSAMNEQEGTPLPPLPSSATPVEGGSSVYHQFVNSDDSPSATPTFKDLPRLPVRERSQSISETESFYKRQRFE